MTGQIKNIAILLLREAVFEKLHWQFMVILSAAFSIGYFAAELALTAADDLQIGMSAEFLRLFVIFIFIIFIVSSSIREFEEGRVAQWLAGPIPRWVYWLGRALAVAILALVLSIASAFVLLVINSSVFIMTWAVSFFLELVLVGLAAIFFSFSLRHLAPAISVVLGFYIIARILDSFLVIITNSLSLNHALLTTQFFDGFIRMLAMIVPALDQFAQSSWLLSQVQGNVLPMLFLEALIYALLLAAVSLFDLYRKELL